METPLLISTILLTTQQCLAEPAQDVISTPRTLTTERITLDISPDMAYTMIDIWQKIQRDIDAARDQIEQKKKEAFSLRKVIINISKNDPTYKIHWDDVRKKSRKQSPRQIEDENQSPDLPLELAQQITKLPPMAKTRKKSVDAILATNLNDLSDIQLITLEQDIKGQLNQKDSAVKQSQQSGKNSENARTLALKYFDFYDQITAEMARRSALKQMHRNADEMSVPLDQES